jgi:uncharacterized SAM-binding protein YcdF (DUF218 family)
VISVRSRASSSSLRKSRWLRALVLFLVVWPLFAWLAARSLIVAAPVPQADVIMLLSGSSTLRERARQAAQIYLQGRAQKIIVTNDGHQGSWSNVEQRNPFYFEITRAELIRQGVPNDKIEVLPQIVLSTHDEAVLLRNHVERNGIRTILLVTSAYHSRRALWTFKRVFENGGVGIGLEPANTGWQTPSPWKWWLHIKGWQMVPTEYLKLIYYRVRF